MPSRRSALLSLAAWHAPGLAGAAPPAPAAAAGAFPRDFGSHPGSRIEWWYITGALEAAALTYGFQITFFRAATGASNAEASRFQAAQIVFAHAAVTDLAKGRLRHDQRIARSGFDIASAAEADTALVLRDWRLVRTQTEGHSAYRASAASEIGGFRFDLALAATQPVLLQGVAGRSQKGPDPRLSSAYYSEPQLDVRGTLGIDRGPAIAVKGRAWLDHEWSDSLLDAQAVGWDWVGMNLDDGGALTAFRLRRANGSTLWAGGSHRPAGGAVRNFEPAEIGFTAGRVWVSPTSKARYPVEWQLVTPVGTFTVRSLQDDQELDSRASTGSIYWEGLSTLLGASGLTVGRGYLEMTGYAGRLEI